MRPPFGLRDVRALRDKYERMLELRRLHARAIADPSFVEPNPKRAMARLSAKYPGALRQIDTLPLETIRARLSAAKKTQDALESGAKPRVALWMRAQVRFHVLARAILIAKRWARTMEGPLPKGARLWKNDLPCVNKPPRGRLMDLVFARIADELGVGVDEARALVFGP